MTTSLIRILTLLILFLFARLYLILYRQYDQPYFKYNHNTVPNNTLTVHVIAHSHLDVGWLKTVDQYYYGLNESIQRAGVQYIFDNVIRELHIDYRKKFILVEMIYFQRWFKSQSPEIQKIVKQLVSEGQLSFAGGGWVMNDESCTHYRSTIDQIALGRSFIFDEFHLQPKVSWQIDAFGHSLVQAELMSQMNTIGMIINRIDYIDANEMNRAKGNEFRWFYGGTNQEWMFTSRLYNHYNPPPGFCFDEHCADDSIVTDENSPVYNAFEKAKQMITYLYNQSAQYRTRHLLLPMGSDFHYQNALHSFKNIDALMRTMRKIAPITIDYSTPAIYLSSVAKEIKDMPRREYDLMQYCHRPFSCWSGFYTSRPGIKLLDRITGSLLQAFRQLTFLSISNRDDSSFLADLEKAHATLQHHDAITGTSKNHVMEDHKLRISKAIHSTMKVMQTFLMSDGRGVIPFDLCLGANISDCRPKNDSRFSMILYNPLPVNLSTICYFPAKGNTVYQIADIRGRKIIHEVIDLPEGLRYLPERSPYADKELAFKCEIPAFKPLIVIVNSTSGINAAKQNVAHAAECSMVSEKFRVVAKPEGAITFYNKIEDVDAEIRIELGYYEGFVGDNLRSETQSDGAYVFRPIAYKRLTATKFGSCDVTRMLVNSTYWNFVDRDEDIKVNVTIRMTKDGPLEVHGIVGSLVGKRDKSRTLVIRYRTNLQQKEYFAMDSNCRRTIKRWMCPAEWFINVNSTVGSCFYPVCAYLFASSPPVEFSIITDRTQGGTVYYDSGTVFEIALNRRTVADDGLGMEEKLDERYSSGEGVWIKFQHKLVLTSTNTGALHRRKLVQQVNNPVLTMLPERPTAVILMWHMTALPEPLNLLTVIIRKVENNFLRLLVRIEHTFEPEEHEIMSEAVVVDLAIVWHRYFKILQIIELTLDGIMPLPQQPESTNLTFLPMMIRTFEMKVERAF